MLAVSHRWSAHIFHRQLFGDPVYEDDYDDSQSSAHDLLVASIAAKKDRKAAAEAAERE